MRGGDVFVVGMFAIGSTGSIGLLPWVWNILSRKCRKYTPGYPPSGA